jgi:hypothetical protein
MILNAASETANNQRTRVSARSTVHTFISIVCDISLQALEVSSGDPGIPRLLALAFLLLERVLVKYRSTLCCPMVINEIYEAIADIAVGFLVHWKVKEVVCALEP